MQHPQRKPRRLSTPATTKINHQVTPITLVHVEINKKNIKINTPKTQKRKRLTLIINIKLKISKPRTPKRRKQ